MKPIVLSYHERPLTQVKLNREGDLLLTAAKDGRCCLIRTETGELLGTYESPSKEGATAPAIFSVDITLDSKFVCVACADGNFCVFGALTGNELCNLHTGGIPKFCEFNHEPMAQNKIVLAQDKFKDSPTKIVVYRWNEKHKSLTEDTVITSLQYPATKVSWGPYDKTLISINSVKDRGNICIWDAETGELIKTVGDANHAAHDSTIMGMQITQRGELLITASKDQTVKVWVLGSTEAGDEPCKLYKRYQFDRPLNDAVISPLYTEKDPAKAKYHFFCGGGIEAKDAALTGGAGRFETVICHLVMSEPTDTDASLATIKGHFGPLNTIAVMPQGQGFVTGGEDGNVRIHFLGADYMNNKKLD